MSDREDVASDEGSGDEIRPYGDDRDSSDESEDEDPEEAKRIAEGFIVDEDEEEDGEGEEEEDEETRRRKKKEKRRRKRKEAARAARKKDEMVLSDDELELLNENQGLAGSSSSRPNKRLRRGSDEGPAPGLDNMFQDDEDRRVREDDDDDDDLGDFIEEDDEEEVEGGETEEQRRQRKREEKIRRREAAKTRPDVAGVDRASWDEIYAVFGDGEEFDWALEDHEGIDPEDEDGTKKDLRLEDVFDPAEIKERRLQDEDKAITQRDRPERHQLVNSTLSENPILAPDSLYPATDLAAGWAYNKISERTQYIFCGMGADDSYPPYNPEYPQAYRAYRRLDLYQNFVRSVSTALGMMFIQHLEVPYLWHYKRDAFSVLENQGQSSVQFLDRDELWRLYELGIRFRAIFERNQQTQRTWDKIKSKRPDMADSYLTQTLLPSICMMSVEAAAEGGDWLAFHYAHDLRQIKEDEAVDDGAKRLPERSGHEDLRSGPIMKLVEAFGISVPTVAVTFNDPQGQPVPPKNPEKAPRQFAEEFAGEGTHFLGPDEALQAATQILITEFAKDPSLRQQARDFIEACGQVSVSPTDRGMTVIDQYHLYYTFKFLTDKPVAMFKDTPQFLHMLQAEEEGLLTIDVKVDDIEIANFADTLVRCVVSGDYGEAGQAWDALREGLCRDVVKKNLIPMASKWIREHLRGEAEDFVAERCRMELEFRTNVQPFASRSMEPGDIPSVLALTNGRGDIKDAVIAVMLDESGNIRTQTKFDNLKDEIGRASLYELLEKRTPNVVVIGGMSVQTARLKEDVAAALRQFAINRSGGMQAPLQTDYPNDFQGYQEAASAFDEKLGPSLIPLIYVNDATARQYMISDESEKEHPTLPLNGRYALGLARYTQNPLNAYCKIGRNISSITFMEHHQKMISNEKLLVHLERALVNVVCSVGIDVNACATDPYERVMLPFIAGMGPRKADMMCNAVLKLGPYVNRLGFAEQFGPTLIENFAGFLAVDSDLKDMVLEKDNPQDQPDPLDLTRIHPEDYEFAQKMSQDAQDFTAEDVADDHKSQVVWELMRRDDRAQKLSELNLDDFAFNLQSQGEGNKRYMLGEIVAELISWRADKRPAFYIPTDWEVVQMLTGETERSIGRGLLVTATVRRAMSSRVFCQLESGIEAVLDREFIADDETSFNSPEDILKPRQAVKAIIIVSEPARLQVRISTRTSELSQGVPFKQPFRDEPFNNIDRQAQAETQAALKKRRAAGASKRIVNHPNWHDMNSGQAEQFLASQHRGDVVIRRSSKGPDHIAVTWKVDEDVYQHIDVQELDKPNEYAIGRLLRVANRYTYSDLDELIINHVKAVARKFDEMQLHEKYRAEDELESYLKNYVQAHPGRSMYGFSIDSDRPGFLKLCFLNKSTKDGGVIQTWPVKVLPGAYQLGSAEVPGVTELCNAFKAQYSSRLADQGSGGKTPGIRTGKTPFGGRTPGGRTPAQAMGARGGATPLVGGQTPNPYGIPGQGLRPPVPVPGYGYPPQQAYGMPPGGPAAAYGGMTPGGARGGPGPGLGPGGAGAPGMNADRAAMIARQGGGGGGGRY